MSKKMSNLRLFILLTLISVVIACSSTEDTSGLEIDLDDLTGLWNSSEKQGNKTDIIYTRVTSEGEIIEYDFDGDAVDQGLDCYQIESGSIKSLTANRFMVNADMHAKQFEVELELLDDGHALKIYFMDEKDPSKTLESQIWTRESDTSILDDEPSCK